MSVSDKAQTPSPERPAPSDLGGPARQDVPGMFNRIAGRYDAVNHLLSLGLDGWWRKQVAAHFDNRPGQRVLDLATGTGDQLVALCSATDKVKEVVGMDLAEEMLALGRAKLRKKGLEARAELRTGDACAIPSPDGAFDAVTISFGIRNVPEVDVCLREMRRILQPGGRALILEFSLPSNPILRSGHLFYLRHVLPHIGGLVSGNAEAYRYLNQTIETFPYGDMFCGLMSAAGFIDVEAHPLTGGIVTLYQGTKGP